MLNRRKLLVCFGASAFVVRASSAQQHSEEKRPLSPSRPFILRPVATALLMAAILLAGIVSYTQLPVSALHASRVAALPLHHRDPFDRLLVAQAILEPLHLMTADAAMKPYSELVMLV